MHSVHRCQLRRDVKELLEQGAFQSAVILASLLRSSACVPAHSLNARFDTRSFMLSVHFGSCLGSKKTLNTMCCTEMRCLV